MYVVPVVMYPKCIVELYIVQPVSGPPHLLRSFRGGVRVAKRKVGSGLDGDSNSIPLEVISPRSVVAEWR
jgi:hypothetical protein